MRKYISFILIFMIIGAGLSYLLFNNSADNPEAIYINIADDNLLFKAKRLKSALESNGHSAKLFKANKHQSGKYNLYMADNLENLPEVKDPNAINMLWTNSVGNDDNWENIRAFDVVVVRSIGSFLHLKAINVRTAFIPDAINYPEKNTLHSNNKFMFYGNSSDSSPIIEKLRQSGIEIDFSPKKQNFAKYTAVFIPQSENDQKNGIINDKIIEVIENGGIPVVAYNQTLEKIFYDVTLMYSNENELFIKLNDIKNNPSQIGRRHQLLKELSLPYNSDMMAKKFIELFNVMQQKRI